MTKNRISPHDRFIKSAMTQPHVAEEFFQNNLPPHILEAVDLSSIEPQKESFIDNHLQLQIADVLFKVNIDGEPGYLYLLMEHASSQSELLPFRMLKYMVAIMDQHLTKTKSKRLPIIYPLVFYTGERPYKHSMDVFDLFGEGRQMARDILKKPYHLVDLTQCSDEELYHYKWFGTAALVMKHIHDPDMLDFFKVLAKILKELERNGASEYIEIVLSYIVIAANVTNVGELQKTIIHEFNDAKEGKVMMLAEKILREWGSPVFDNIAAENLQKGRLEGRLEGQLEGNRKFAAYLLKLGQSIDSISSETGLSTEDIEKLKNQNDNRITLDV